MSNVCVVMYHGIDDSGSVISTSRETFQRQISCWRSQGIHFLTLNEFLAHRQGAPTIGRSILITFDDALLSVHAEAFPLLRDAGIPATIFVVSNFMGRTNEWPGQPSFVPPLPIMTWEQAREMQSAGFEFGVHTANHPHLAKLDRPTIETELDACTDCIKNELGTTPRSVAYPYGSSSPTVHDIAKARFELGFATRVGFPNRECDPLEIPRVDAYDLRSDIVFTRLFEPAGRAYLLARGALRRVRASLK